MILVYILAVVGGLYLFVVLCGALSEIGPTCKTQAEANEAVRRRME